MGPEVELPGNEGCSPPLGGRCVRSVSRSLVVSGSKALLGWAPAPTSKAIQNASHGFSGLSGAVMGRGSLGCRVLS